MYVCVVVWWCFVGYRAFEWFGEQVFEKLQLYVLTIFYLVFSLVDQWFRVLQEDDHVFRQTSNIDMINNEPNTGGDGRRPPDHQHPAIITVLITITLLFYRYWIDFEIYICWILNTKEKKFTTKPYFSGFFNKCIKSKPPAWLWLMSCNVDM